MRVPFEWLKEFVDLKAAPTEVGHKLTMIGLEVEAIEQVNDDYIFEVNVTPNRPDCLSIIGIARELSAAYRVPLKFPKHDVLSDPGELDFNVDILDTPLCNRYAGRVVKNLKIAPSPDWLKSRLDKCGLRSINNIVDITNYVLLEFGHPLHAFDLGTIKGHRIRVGTPNTVKGNGANIKFETLDGIKRDVPPDSLMIWDAKRPIAIAGIMGGLETEVNDATKDIFIESAYFDPMSVRRTSKLLGLKTESSYRFERETDIKVLKKALDRAAYLMKEVAGGTIYGKIDLYPKRYAPVRINIKYDEINGLLGLKLKKKEILACLDGLGLEIKEEPDHLIISPPAFRKDLKGKADIVEEIARMYGYDKITPELPKATIGMEWQGSEIKNDQAGIKKNIREALLKLGYAEAVNYSFMGLHELDLLGIAENDNRRNLLQVKNPLRAEDSFMRSTLVPSLIKNLVHNISHGNKEIELFEMARVFINEMPNSLPTEKDHLAAIYYRERNGSLYKDDILDFYKVKGSVEAIFNDLKIHGHSFVRSSEPFLHPGQSADIFLMGNKIGYLGAISPAIIDVLDIKANKPAVIALELDIDSIMPYTLQVVKYMPLPKYPFIERDTAVILAQSLEASNIINWLKAYSSELIEDIHIFDVYQGKNIPQGKKSVAFNIRYRAANRTLKDDEIDALHSAVVKYILDKTDGQLRQ